LNCQAFGASTYALLSSRKQAEARTTFGKAVKSLRLGATIPMPKNTMFKLLALLWLLHAALAQTSVSVAPNSWSVGTPTPTPREDRASQEPSDGACEFAVESHELRESGWSCAAGETILDGSFTIQVGV
jgi:hypothetical protein